MKASGLLLLSCLAFAILLAGISALGVNAAAPIFDEQLFHPQPGELPNGIAAQCPPPSSLTYDQRVECTIESIGEQDTFTFTGVIGERIQLRMLDIGGSVFSPKFEVRRPDGSHLCGADYWDPFIESDCTLDTSGTYTIVAGDYGDNQTGSYSLYLQRLNNPVNAEAGGYDSYWTGSIGLAPETKAYTFSGVSGERVQVRMLDTGGTIMVPEFRVYRPDGTYLCGGNYWNPFIEADCTLDATGTYAILAMDDSGVNIGSYSLYLQRLNNPVGCRSIVFGAPPLSDSIDFPPETDCFTFGGHSSDQIRVTMVDTSGTQFSPEIRVIRPDGTLLCSAGYWDPSVSLDCTLDFNGGYSIFAMDDGGVFPGSYNISLTCLNAPCGFAVPAITSVLPNLGLADIPNEINIYGSGFANGAVVSLGTLNLSTTYIASTHLRAMVPSGLTPGTYHVFVTNPDGGFASLPNGYTVIDLQDPNLDDLYGYDFELWVDPGTPRAGEAALLGLVVHRQGGKSTLSNVEVRFYKGDPLSGGVVIGNGSLPLLSPRGSASTTGVAWTPAIAGNYTIYAVIDPDDTITETNEVNNWVYRTITVQSPAGDQVAPHVDSFSINNGADTTNTRDVSLDTIASDPAPSSGLASLLFVEYEYSQSAGLWFPVRISNWLPYATSRLDYPWNMLPFAGMHYIQAWAADKTGNISLFPYLDLISYDPATDHVEQGQNRIYRYTIAAGQQVVVTLTPVSGDPDLYVWAPDHSTRPPWVSNLGSGVDQVSFTAPISGIYQVEVYGFNAADYQLSVDITAEKLNTHGSEANSIDVDKPMPSQPVVPIASVPGDKFGHPPTAAAESDQKIIYLPLVVD